MDQLNSEMLLEKHARIWRHRNSRGEIIPFVEQEQPRLAFRTYRAISWYEHATRHNSEDVDAAFIFYWISFNAAYASTTLSDRPEREGMRIFFEKVILLDKGRDVENAIWMRFSGPIRLISQNELLFQPYLNFLDGKPNSEDWEAKLKGHRDQVSRALERRDTTRLLGHVFGPLYTLRNQLMHGGAKWGSSRNRNTVRDGTAIMSFLIPIFLNLMLDNRENTDWGEPYFFLSGEGP